jgi:hypothetical protein
MKDRLSQLEEEPIRQHRKSVCQKKNTDNKLITKNTLTKYIENNANKRDSLKKANSCDQETQSPERVIS